MCLCDGELSVCSVFTFIYFFLFTKLYNKTRKIKQFFEKINVYIAENHNILRNEDI